MCGIAGIASEIADPRSSVSTEQWWPPSRIADPTVMPCRSSAAACLEHAARDC